MTPFPSTTLNLITSNKEKRIYEGSDFIPADVGETVNDVEGADGYNTENLSEDEDEDMDADFGLISLDSDEFSDFGDMSDDIGSYLGNEESDVY